MRKKKFKTLRTLRLKPDESRMIESYLKNNPIFENFSSLTRAALLSFIQSKQSLPLSPARLETSTQSLKTARPSFIWEYDLTKTDLKQILQSSNITEKRSFMGKILCEAPFEEVWEYLTPEDIEAHLPYLRMPEKIKNHWKLALHVWKK